MSNSLDEKYKVAIKLSSFDFDYTLIDKLIDKFKRKNIEIGISDGINVEVISGINLNDRVKIWNRTQSDNLESETDIDDKDEN